MSKDDEHFERRMAYFDAENARLRAELARAEEAAGDYQALERTNAQLNAELAALKDVFRSKKFRSGCSCHIDDDTETVVELCDLHREREDTLRAELNVARELLDVADKRWDWGSAKSDWYERLNKWRARIDAALAKGGGDE